MMRHKLLEQKYGLNSDEALAVEILDLIHLMRMALTDHDMASPHVWTFRLSKAAEFARLKRLWEPQVEFSKKTREKRRKANEESIKTRAAISKKNRDASRSKAIELWRHTPMNIKPTADIIAKDLNLNPHTTRGYLMHPEEWSPFHSLKTKKFDHP